MKNVSPDTAANLEKSLGYSKAILGAIKGQNGLTENSPSASSAEIDELANASTHASIAPADQEDIKQKKKNFEVLRSPQKGMSAAVRQRKSVSCDLTETAPSAIDLIEPKKSQSLRQVDQTPDTSRRGGTASIRSGRSTATRNASTISGSSKSSKDKDFVEMPFKICADALHASATDDISLLKKLLSQHPAVLNYAYPHCFRFTCLHVAARAGHLSLIRYLAERGANPNARDDNWQTPLHLAAVSNKSAAFQLLRSFKADDDILDVYGMAARDYLKDSKADGPLNTLSELGSSINSTIAGISDFVGASTRVADSSISNQSVESNNSTFQRIGSFRPLRRQVKRVRHLFNN